MKGTSKFNDGVVGSSSTQGKSGVFGFNTEGNGPVFGVSGSVNSPDGAGINGSSDKGYGGSFSGGRASLRLVPADTRGSPTRSEGNLFYCKDDGTPGNWHRVQLIQG